MKAAGIGLLVGLLAKMMEVFSKNQKVIDAFDTAMNSLSIAFNDLFSFLSNNIGTVIDFFKDIFENPVQSIKDFGIKRFLNYLKVILRVLWIVLKMQVKKVLIF